MAHAHPHSHAASRPGGRVRAIAQRASFPWCASGKIRANRSLHESKGSAMKNAGPDCFPDALCVRS
ncbi:hypothetical protein X941_5690 [Burkholderia pseudomallei MSHR5569]|nr:hypothetical protein X941_5690 [Burkholderia pseudomallei MSHR5569]